MGDRTILRIVMMLAILSCLVSVVFGSQGVISLESYPTMTVADGRSTVTVTAQIRDENGSLVPDGTQVVFDSNLGTFRDKVVLTQNGYARAVLVAGNLVGIARVRASVLRFGAISDLDIEFVGDRSLLSTAREFIEVSGSETLQYSVQDQVIEATGANKGAKLTYRDIEVVADDMQVRVPAYEVRARRAEVTIGKNVYKFDELFMTLNRKTGVGIGTYEKLAFDDAKRGTGSWPIKKVLGYGPVTISANGVKPVEGEFDSRVFNYQTIAESVSRVKAEKAVAYPRKEIHFYKADVVVTGQSLMRVPLFKVNLFSRSPLVTEEFINVSNNDLAINYPYYVSLSPNQQQLFRFRWGNRYATGTGASGGAFLDYEFNWTGGEQAEGGLALIGLGRDDWGATLRQNWSFGTDTNVSAVVDFPAHRSMFASGNLSQRLGGAINTNLNASYGQSLSGNRFKSNAVSFIAESDPIRMGKFPARLSLGVNGSQTSLTGDGFSNSQQTAGIQSRFVGDPIRLGSSSRINWSYTIAQQFRSAGTNGLTHVASVYWNVAPSSALGLNLGYEFVDDGFFSSVLGRHKLNLEAYYREGPFSLTGFATKTLDIDRIFASARLRYELGDLWRAYYYYALDRFSADSFFDQSFIVSYKFGYRELGLSYSSRTKRIGIEVLGTSFN